MRSYFQLILYISTFLFSCEKQEIPVPKRAPGDVTINQINMGADYSDQIFYRLSDNSVVSRNLRSIWDLSFESSSEGWHVLVNSSKTMKVAFFEGADFNDDLTIAAGIWKYDASTGNLDSTAIGDWRNANGIFVVDRGLTTLGTPIGNMKFKVIEMTASSFTIQYANMDGSNLQTAQINKDNDLNYTYFSFETGQVNVSPHKDTWDLLFTQYTYVFYDVDVTPYQVTGVLLNPNNVEATMVDDVPFEDIDLDFAINKTLNNELDAIGYNWKSYSLTEGHYTIYSNQIYIIKDVEGIYYKLHFTDFYSESGVKGAPKFEFQKL